MTVMDVSLKARTTRWVSCYVAWMRWGGGLLVSIASIWLLVRRLDGVGVRSALAVADYRWVVAGSVVVVATIFTRYRRWQVLLNWPCLPGRTVLTALLVGQVVNLVAPARSGDLVRALWILPEGEVHLAEILGSVVVEKLWDLLAFFACVSVLLLLMSLPSWLVRTAWMAALVLVIVVGAVWSGALSRSGRLLDSLTPLPRWVSQNPEHPLQVWFRRLAAGVASLRQPRVFRQALFWTGLTWTCGWLTNFFVLVAFDLFQPTAALFLLAALMVGGAVPVPGRLGIFEGICVVSLALFGVPPDRALAVGLVLHLVVMGPPLVVVSLLLLWPSTFRRIL